MRNRIFIIPLESIYIGIEREKGIGIIECSKQFPLNLFDTIHIKFQIFPRC